MDDAYLHETCDESLMEKVLRTENIPAIEELLHSHSKEFERLRGHREHGKLDFDVMVAPDELEELIPRIGAEVEEITDVRNASCPQYTFHESGDITFSWWEKALFAGGYTTSATIMMPAAHYFLTGNGLGSMVFAGEALLMTALTGFVHYTRHSDKIEQREPLYYPSDELMNLSQDYRTNFIPTISHEYAHHIQNLEGFDDEVHEIFTEGHARGVEKKIARLYCDREDNEAYLFWTLDLTVGELKSTYRFSCRKAGQKPRNSLLTTKSSKDKDEMIENLVQKRPTHHALGTTLFSIYEAQEGDTIYKDTLNGEFSFP